MPNVPTRPPPPRRTASKTSGVSAPFRQVRPALGRRREQRGRHHRAAEERRQQRHAGPEGSGENPDER